MIRSQPVAADGRQSRAALPAAAPARAHPGQRRRAGVGCSHPPWEVQPRDQRRSKPSPCSATASSPRRSGRASIQPNAAPSSAAWHASSTSTPTAASVQYARGTLDRWLHADRADRGAGVASREDIHESTTSIRLMPAVSELTEGIYEQLITLGIDTRLALLHSSQPRTA